MHTEYVATLAGLLKMMASDFLAGAKWLTVYNPRVSDKTTKWLPYTWGNSSATILTSYLTHTLTHTHIHKHAHTHTYTCTHTRAHTHTHLHFIKITRLSVMWFVSLHIPCNWLSEFLELYTYQEQMNLKFLKLTIDWNNLFVTQPAKEGLI